MNPLEKKITTNGNRVFRCYSHKLEDTLDWIKRMELTVTSIEDEIDYLVNYSKQESPFKYIKSIWSEFYED